MVSALFVLEVGVIVVVALLIVEETLPGGVGKGGGCGVGREALDQGGPPHKDL